MIKETISFYTKIVFLPSNASIIYFEIFNTNGDFEFINAINLWIDVGLFLTYYLKVFNV